MHPLPQDYHVYKLSTIYLARSKNSFMRIKKMLIDGKFLNVKTKKSDRIEKKNVCE